VNNGIIIEDILDFWNKHHHENDNERHPFPSTYGQVKHKDCLLLQKAGMKVFRGSAYFAVVWVIFEIGVNPLRKYLGGWG